MMPEHSPSSLLLAINHAFTSAQWGDFLRAPPPSQRDGDLLPWLPWMRGKAEPNNGRLRETQDEPVLGSTHQGDGRGGLLSPRTEAGRRYIFSKGLALLSSLLHRKAEFEVFKPIYFCM